MKIDSPLIDSNITLRALTKNDITTTYLSWLSDIEITGYLEIRFSPPKSLKDLENYINTLNESNNFLILGIFLNPELVHIGNIKLGPIDRNHSSSDIGILIGDRVQWGKGYSTSAIKMLSDYAFTKLGLIKLTASCYSSNQGSRHAFLNAGFVEEGRRIGQYALLGKREDALLLGKINPNNEIVD
jgi:RimJ/RimL family protein N-acetyltransferase